MSAIDIEKLLQLVRDSRMWVQSGVVEEWRASPASPRVIVRLQPEGAPCECEVGYPAGRHFARFDVGAEVVVVFLRADRTRAVALQAIPGGPDPVPSSWDGSDDLLLAPGGLRVQRTDGAAVEAVLQADRFQPDLSEFISAFGDFLTATSTAVTAPQIATAAATLLVRLGLPVPELPEGVDPPSGGPVLSLPGRVAADAYSTAALSSE